NAICPPTRCRGPEFISQRQGCAVTGPRSRPAGGTFHAAAREARRFPIASHRLTWLPLARTLVWESRLESIASLALGRFRPSTLPVAGVSPPSDACRHSRALDRRVCRVRHGRRGGRSPVLRRQSESERRGHQSWHADRALSDDRRGGVPARRGGELR